MEHYDLRVIEDCLVFSYEVECPNYPKENALEQKNYSVCINLILKLNKLDDELFFILASCYY